MIDIVKKMSCRFAILIKKKERMAVLLSSQTRIGIGDISVPLAVGPLEEQFIKSIIRILAVALNPPHSLWAIDCFSLLSAVININTVKDKTLYPAFKQDKLVEVVANGDIPQAAGTFINYY